jgi:hypothetical protein
MVFKQTSRAGVRSLKDFAGITFALFGVCIVLFLISRALFGSPIAHADVQTYNYSDWTSSSGDSGADGGGGS